MIGIAAVMPGDGRSKGDILVAEAIVPILERKRTPQGEQYRPEHAVPCDTALLSRVRELGKPSIRTGIIISQSDLSRDAAYRDGLREHVHKYYGKGDLVIGLEMEGGGLASAIQNARVEPRPTIMLIKSGVDWANYHKSDDLQKSAAKRAAIFTRDLLRSEPVAPRGPEGYTPLKPEVDLERLPPAAHPFVGRKSELNRLNKALKNPNVHAVVLVGPGGSGKSALVSRWLGKMTRPGRGEAWGGAKCVFAWSFTSQGLEDPVVSADEFLDHALGFFDNEFTKSAATRSTAKIDRLISFVLQAPSILILDGLETIQDIRPGATEAPIRHPAVRKLVHALGAKNSRGLCVITTHAPIEEILLWRHSTAPVIEVRPLTASDATDLLLKLGVHGSSKELKMAAAEYGFHPLALTLLGTDLKRQHAGAVQGCVELYGVLSDQQTDERRHAYRILIAHRDRYSGQPAMSALHLVSLFDRPAERSALDVLRRQTIPGLTELLVHMADSEWDGLLMQLSEETQLIKPGDSTVYVHPLIRQFFRADLERHSPAAWRQAHERLFDYFRRVAKPFPDTVQELEPLYRAVSHACSGGLHSRAFDEVYWPRISREEKDYSARRLTAFSSELSALAGFFLERWGRVVPNLPVRIEALVMIRAGSALRALGRLQRAITPIRKAIDVSERRGDWEHAAKASGDLCGLLQTLDRLDEAFECGEQSVKYGERAESLYYQVNGMSRIGATHHMQGRLELAEAKFKAAEFLQGQQSSDPILSSLAAVRYCDFLVDVGQWDEVRRRWEFLLNHDGLSASVLDKPLFQLVLARAELALGHSDEAERWLDASKSVLQEVNIAQFLAEWLLLSAQVALSRNSLEEADRLLQESELMIKSCELFILRTDQHLLMATLWHRRGAQRQVRGALAAVSERVNANAYHARKNAYRELQECLFE